MPAKLDSGLPESRPIAWIGTLEEATWLEIETDAPGGSRCGPAVARHPRYLSLLWDI